MLYKRLIWLIQKHPYTPDLICSKKIFHFSKLPKTVAKKTKNMTSFPCSVHPENFHPYEVTLEVLYQLGKAAAECWLHIIATIVNTLPSQAAT